MTEINYDIHDENSLKTHCAKSEQIADQYKDACISYSDSKLALDKLYVKAIREQQIKESMAYEKALPLVAEASAEGQAEYENFIKSEMLMKGLEKVLNTRGQTAVLHMALMKNRQSQKV